MKVAVAISGGTDSMYALLTLKEQGYDVFGLHAHFLTPDEQREAELGAMCESLGVTFHAVDLHDEFESCVVSPFISAYQNGKTPNPCALCNASMKFGALLREARLLGADTIATGHYAVLADHPTYGRILARGEDPKKDQSYFLSLVPQATLAHVLFPLGSKTKEAIKQELAERNLTPPYPSESQEICFIPDDDYRQFLKDREIPLGKSGAMVTTSGEKVGQHKGLWQYTEGQRKGLGVAWSEPLYVIRKDIEKNTLVVGGKKDLFVNGCIASQTNILVPYGTWPDELFVRIRYRQQPCKAQVTLQDGMLTVHFDEPQTPPAAGQICCVYDAEQNVLAGGIIEKSV